MKRIADGKIEGDDRVMVEGSAGSLKSCRSSGSEGKDIVGLCESRKSVVE